MANGVMLGAGTQNDPWVVEDAWDLDSLRNLSATDWHWVKIENDISVGSFPNWIPIPSRRFNIDGNNKTISNLRIVASSGAAGLFAQLETLDTRDLRIEAEIVHSSTSTSDKSPRANEKARGINEVGASAVTTVCLPSCSSHSIFLQA